jgi:hypothetical protein
MYTPAFVKHISHVGSTKAVAKACKRFQEFGLAVVL